MLPTAEDDAVCLTDVLVSCLAAVGIPRVENRAGIPPSGSVVLVVVDGLGSHNLARAHGHARFLNSSHHLRSDILTVFPSTTASALASLMTGVEPVQHGIVGYRIRDPKTGRVFNQLGELHQAPPEWMRAPTLAERIGSVADIHIVGRSKFAQSPLTSMIYAGATYTSAESFSERFHVAASLAQQRGRVIVVYVSELDSLAHTFGVDSSEWIAELEELDSCVRGARSHMPDGARIVITADHGVIDVPASQHSIFTNRDLVEGVSDIGGEPRCLQLFLDEGADVARIVAAWSSFVGESADVMTRDHALAYGLFRKAGNLDPSILERIGEVLVLARTDTVFYDGNAANTRAQRMIGQHGACSRSEMTIPLIVVN